MQKADFQSMIAGLKAKYVVEDGEAQLVPHAPSYAEIRLSKFPERYRNLTFADFRFHGTPEQMASQRKLVAFLKAGKPAVMYGNNGAGKTMLAFCAIREQLMAGRDAEYATMKDIIDLVKNCWSNGTSELRVIERYVRPDYLVIDELDKGYGSETEFLNIFAIVNRRYNDRKTTVLISNASRADVDVVVGKSVVDRIGEDGVMAPMTWDSYRPIIAKEGK